jgi:hypothetical protein
MILGLRSRKAGARGVAIPLAGVCNSAGFGRGVQTASRISTGQAVMVPKWADRMRLEPPFEVSQWSTEVVETISGTSARIGEAFLVQARTDPSDGKQGANVREDRLDRTGRERWRDW